MHTTAARTIGTVLCASVLLIAMARPSSAGDLQRIRTPSRLLRAVLSDSTEKSTTLKAIVDRVDASNVIVYVTCDRFDSVLVNGKTIWAEGSREARYLRVKVDCMLPRASLVAILGHELQHVAEVADAPQVVDEASFAKLFSRIGYATCDKRTLEQFETNGAITAGERVRQEVLYGWPVRVRVVANARSGVPVE